MSSVFAKFKASFQLTGSWIRGMAVRLDCFAALSAMACQRAVFAAAFF
jgi:hypothetical protein